MSWNLSRNQKIAVYVPILSVLLGAVLSWYAYEWKQPFIRFEEGQYYRVANLAVTGLKLQNIGHSDAEEITVHSAFRRKLNDLMVGDPTIPLTVTNGGKGEDFVVCRIPRLVPTQTIYIYFAVETGGAAFNDVEAQTVRQVIFKGGMGSVKQPFYQMTFPMLFGLVLGFGISALLAYFVRVYARPLEDELKAYKEDSKAWHDMAKGMLGKSSAAPSSQER